MLSDFSGWQEGDTETEVQGAGVQRGQLAGESGRGGGPFLLGRGRSQELTVRPCEAPRCPDSTWDHSPYDTPYPGDQYPRESPRAHSRQGGLCVQSPTKRLGRSSPRRWERVRGGAHPDTMGRGCLPGHSQGDEGTSGVGGPGATAAPAGRRQSTRTPITGAHAHPCFPTHNPRPRAVEDKTKDKYI